jgi:hypothetical protein
MDTSSPEILNLNELYLHEFGFSFALRIQFLQTHSTFYRFYSSVTVHCTVKEKEGKPDRKTYPSSLWFKKSIQKPQV